MAEDGSVRRYETVCTLMCEELLLCGCELGFRVAACLGSRAPFGVRAEAVRCGVQVSCVMLRA